MSVVFTLHFFELGQLVVETNEYFLPLTVFEREKVPLSCRSAEKLLGAGLWSSFGMSIVSRRPLWVILPVSGENAAPPRCCRATVSAFGPPT